MAKAVKAIVEWKLDTPAGELTVTAAAAGITQIRWGEEKPGVYPLHGDEPFSYFEEGPHVLVADADQESLQSANNHALSAIRQLKEYFDGERRTFDLPLLTQGTDFQQAVLTALGAIPYGEVVTYKDIAVLVGRPQAARAVGQVNRHNRFPVVIPCHRVMGTGGSPVGYNGNQIDLKLALIDLERQYVHQERLADKRAAASH